VTRAARIPDDVCAVDVYRNLHTGTWSAKAARGPERGRVVAHPSVVVLADCTFRVSAAGRERVRRERSKNVHAMVRGTPVRARPRWPASLVKQVTYNPYQHDGFVDVATGRIVTRAAWVSFPTRGPLTVGLYPEDGR
jgi:hypothetical protein